METSPWLIRDQFAMIYQYVIFSLCLFIFNLGYSIFFEEGVSYVLNILFFTSFFFLFKMFY